MKRVTRQCITLTITTWSTDIASSQGLVPIRSPSIQNSYGARTRHRASRNSCPLASHHHSVAALTVQIRRLRRLAPTGVHLRRLLMTSFSAVGLQHLPDPRCAVFPLHPRHPFCFDFSLLAPNHIILSPRKLAA